MKKFKIESAMHDEQTIYIKITGELRRGKDLELDPEFSLTINDAIKSAKLKQVVFDLKELTYWDTKGILGVVNAVITMNETRPHSSGVISPKDANLFFQAKKKHSAVGTPSVPWEHNFEALIDKLSE